MKEGAQKRPPKALAGPTIDGTDQLEEVQRLVFADGASAYVLGGSNPSTLSAADVQSLAGNGQLAVLGDGSQPLHLSGAWGDIGQRTIGNVLYDVYHNSGAQLLVQSGVQVTVDQQLLTPIAYWTFDGAGAAAADSAGAAQNGVFYANGQPDRDDAVRRQRSPPSAQAHRPISTTRAESMWRSPMIKPSPSPMARSRYGSMRARHSDSRCCSPRTAAGPSSGLTIGLDGNHLIVQMEGPSGV